MKIQDVRTIVLADRFVIAQVLTDEGLIGIGECSPMNAAVTVPMVDLLRDLLVGEDPRDIERLWDKMLVGSYKLQGRAAALAISGVEIALWDILGKSVDLPVYRLLGGSCREKIRMYATLSRDTLQNLVSRARAAVDHGFTGVKVKVATRWGFDAKPDPTVETIRAIREEIGLDVEIMVDANSGWTVPTAIRMCRDLEPFRILHLEQPVPERDLDALASVNQSTTIPITFGEEDWSLWRYREVIEKGAAEILQADPIKAAGILGCKKVAVLAEAYSKILTPHNTSVHVGMAATLHLVATVPISRNPIECLILPESADSEGLETSRTGLEASRNKSSEGVSEVKRHLLNEPFKVENGSIKVPEGPGLGIELNADIVRKYASGPVDLG